ncbi:MAG TPA: translation elongation factor Ts [Acidimicrobiales bacterium]|jgi:elongation factor Ts|nr:translation elongation factor Ts [Acidimicrobiales bacterium]
MANFTAKDVQRLRQLTGAGMLDCKKALEATDGDVDRAVNWLREKGLAQTGKRSERANEQGAVATANTGTAAAAVELKCETDFVAKSPDFTALAHEMAQAVAERGESAVDEFKDQLDGLRITLKENIDVGRVVRFEAAEGAVLDTYLHSQNDRGVNGVIVELSGGDRALAHEVALHVASMRPQWLTRDEVPEERVAAEREVLENLTRNEGKPEQAVPKIVEGRIGGFFKDNVLLEQPYVKDAKQTVRQLLGNASLTRFAQVEIGR